MATADRMLKKIKELGLKLPEWGSGRNGKILNSDLEEVLAAYFFKQEEQDWGACQRRALNEVQLAYRYDQLKPEEQAYVMADNNEWVAEEKFNGCRMIITYHKKEGFRAYGRNRSKYSYLPIDYSDKILVGNTPLSQVKLLANKNTDSTHSIWDHPPVVLDCELMTGGYVETQSGSFTNKSLNAAVSVLQLSNEESHLAQKTTAPLWCAAFDYISFGGPALITATSFTTRRKLLEAFVSNSEIAKYMRPFFQLPKQIFTSKEAYLNGLLAEGKEGIVLKNLNSPYVRGLNGYRDKNACIKVKRTMTGSFGDEIDAYIIGSTNGSEWDKRDAIAGLKLAVYLRDGVGNLKEHWIATVSGIPDEIRFEMSEYSALHYAVEGNKCVPKPCLRSEFYGKVLTIDGLDISARNRRISHAKVDWKRGFREDKTASQCIMDESFIDSQMF